jgi:hypothetical protein
VILLIYQSILRLTHLILSCRHLLGRKARASLSPLFKMGSSTFDEVLGLEEKFYHDGYRQGMADGVKAGRIEGRTFGLEKGFEKYVESGRLYGKSLVWANRIPQLPFQLKLESPHLEPPPSAQKLPPLPDNQRLVKHLKVFHALAESESLSTENSEEAVSDFDDRFKRAQAKEKVIERLVGESKGGLDGSGKMVNGNGNIEDASIRNAIQ